ncbi:hydroxyacylglutathione hydrolase [Acuticoccus sp. MNP-M23]|uniref:hydroxyacylglutathione hydrolase n=1 Tax=Acuticoccus sp. MNP-M23 TaxID=3072793 RepID=UPI002815E6AF|nr:hydroxyacylglutathione hydrolase [Acuticoccus sp. MNP-M23]WMS42885.1 hydroxyacylglutathione hydrolase [Acuticoccus sp. MNP-M23]
MTDVRLVPCLSDNYAVLVHSGDETLLVDAPDADAIQAALAETGWTLTTILITHHHADHVKALAAVRGNAHVVGPRGEAHRIDGLDQTVADGETFSAGPFEILAVETPGHTAAPASYVMNAEGIAFTGDTLFAMGCGRLFEGDAATMWASMRKLRDVVTDETRIYCGHEYTLKNAQYAHSVLPDDAAVAERLASVEADRAEDKPTVPSVMAVEKATNPFLRADDPAVARALGMEGAAPEAVFATLREGRDTF